MKTPHRCPVCEGRQTVPEWFYMVQPGGYPTSSGVGTTPCRTCNGTGVLWGDLEDDEPKLKLLKDQP